MKARTVSIAAAVLLLAAGVYGAYRLGQRSAAAPATLAVEPGRKVLYWQDPMVPGQRFDKPGKSPYMDMDLVPVYADQQAGDAAVRISAGARQNLGIRYAQVREATLDGALRLVGNVAFDERARVLVQARSSGYVEHLYVRAPLDPVRKGQALLDLYVPEWVAAQEEYLSIRRMAPSQAAGLADAAAQRMRLAGMSDEQVRQVVARGKLVRRVTVTAPQAGVISELAAREGATVINGAPLMTISGLRSVWVNAAVPESAAAQVRPGMPVHASAPAWPGERFEGRVEALLPEVDPATRTMTARIALANPAGRLSPGMFADITLASPGRKPVLVVPSEALIQTGTRSLVILAEEGGKFTPVEVTPGAESNGETQVLAGLRAGQRVVASGQFLIDSEASLRGALRRLESGTPDAAATPAAAAVHHASGKIERIAAAEVTISHGPIPTLKWGPMTMGFAPPAGGMPPGFKAGDSVDFELSARADGRYQITAIRARAGRLRQGAGGQGKHTAPQESTADGHASHAQPQETTAPAPAPADPHGGHEANPHAGHDMGAGQ